MSNRIRQTLLTTSLLAYLVFAFATTGLLTNWFRYGASLEALVVLGPLGLISVVVIGLHLSALLGGRHNSVTTVWAFVSTVGGVLITLLFNNSASGQYWPEWYQDHVEQNEAQQLVTNRGELT